jgi:hypothetical protein
MRLIKEVGLVTVAVLFTAGMASAAQVGDIQVFYNSTPNFGQGVLDGPVFVFQNTTGTAITDAVLTIVGVDFFDVGTIAAHSNVFVIPGVSNDGQNHGSGNFFTVTGSIYDSSDEAVNSDSVEFEFSGKQGSTAIESSDVCGVIAAPIFTPACTQGEANDGTVSNINFLGGPGNNDGPCNNCFGPEIVANLITPNTPPPSSIPEPATFIPLGTGLVGLLGWALRGSRQALDPRWNQH